MSIVSYESEAQCLSLLKVSDISDKTISKDILSSHLETPKHGYINDYRNLHITGWILSKDPQAEVNVVAIGKASRSQVTLTINRADVIEKKFKTKTHAQLRCGFLLEIETETPVELFIQVNDQLHLWKKIDLLPIDKPQFDSIQTTWDSYCRDNLEEITSDNAKLLESLDTKLVESLIFKSPIVIRNISHARTSERFTNTELEHISQFLNSVDSGELFVTLVNSALELGEFRINNPFDPGYAKGSESFIFPSKINCLRLITESKETFFIFQRVTSIDAVYFPCRGIVILFHYMTLPMISTMIAQICREFSVHLVNSRKKSGRRFLGIVASQGRPFHFYYDVAPAMHLLAQQGLMEKLPSIIMYEGENYFSFKSLYGLSCDESVKDWREINQLTATENGFIMNVGWFFSPKNEALIQQLDEQLVTCAINNIDSETAIEVDKARACQPLIWFGVTGQKRSWIEQIDAAINIFTNLADKYPNLGVVFDGWTSPISPTKGDLLEASKDAEIVQQICSKLPSEIPTFTVVGSNSIRKLAFAACVDAYIANSASGSIHIARLAKKPGIGHLNTKMRSSGLLYQTTIEVPISDIRDIPDPENPRMDFTSYSIDWRVVYNLLTELIDKKLLR